MIYWSITPYKNSSKKEQSTHAHKAMLALLTHVTKTDHWQIEKTPKGKPYAVAPDGQTGPHISLSHSQKQIACAISTDGPIGIDIEFHKPRAFKALAAFAYGPKEQKYIKDNGMEAFYKVWVVRESCAKSAGKGILSTLNGQDLLTNFDGSPYWSTQKWSCYFTKIGADYSLAITTPLQEKWDKKSITRID